MTKTTEKASRAESLRVSKLFQEFHDDALAEQKGIFANPAALPDQIAEAHAIIRALDKLKTMMGRAIQASKIEQKRAAKKV